jgi:hypothetical protein
MKSATVNPATVSRVLSLIPDRTVRLQTGAAFLLEGTACRHPERLAHVVKFLSWLSPLDTLGKDDQRVLGLISANGRPVQSEEDEPDEMGADAEMGTDPIYEELAA